MEDAASPADRSECLLQPEKQLLRGPELDVVGRTSRGGRSCRRPGSDCSESSGGLSLQAVYEMIADVCLFMRCRGFGAGKRGKFSQTQQGYSAAIIAVDAQPTLYFLGLLARATASRTISTRKSFINPLGLARPAERHRCFFFDVEPAISGCSPFRHIPRCPCSVTNRMSIGTKF